MALSLCMSTSAAAQACVYKGRKYAQGVAVCQAGLVQLCMGGEWQDQGRFCSEPDGTALGKPFLGPGQVDVPPQRQPPPPPPPPPSPTPAPTPAPATPLPQAPRSSARNSSP